MTSAQYISILSSRLTFSGSFCPFTLRVRIEIISDLENNILISKNWDPEELN